MDINSWLTIVTVFLALIAFLPQHERNLQQMKLSKWELYSSFILLILVIPFLIYFRKFETRFASLSTLTIKNGYEPHNIAFGLFYLIFIWILIRLFVWKPKDRIDQSVTDYFKRILSEIPFPQFFALFLKYSPSVFTKNDWRFYRQIIMDPIFLNGVRHYQPNYIFSLLSLINRKDDFKAIFLPIVQDIQSIYYREIKENDGHTSISQGSPFLMGVAVVHLNKALKLDLRQIVSDTAKIHVRSERSKSNSGYLQEHLYGHMQGEEGYDLPLYFHIRFIALLYGTAIQNRVDTHPHMHTIYAGMISEMVNNLAGWDEYTEKEFPTNYHWLISGIFGEISTWMDTFGTEQTITNDDYETETGYFYFDDHSSYVDFIPSCFNFSAVELYKGYEAGKIKPRFISRMFHYYLFGYYFRHDAKPEVLSSIEENAIRHIPADLLPEILDLTLDENFAGDYENFIERKFAGHGIELQRQDRLWKYLKSINGV